MRFLCFILLSVVFIGTSAQSSLAGFIRHDRPVSAYNELALKPEFAATGYVYHPSVGFWHTGTLVAPNIVLTSAHAFDPDMTGIVTRPVREVVFGFHHQPLTGKTYRVSHVIPHMFWPLKAPQHDVALLYLEEPVEDVTPARITTKKPHGLTGVSVGYGIQGDGLGNELVGANQRLASEVQIDYVGPEDGHLLDYLGLAPEFAEEVGTTIRADFDHPDGSTNTYGGQYPLNLEGGTATGDSGGPLFIQDEQGWAVAGVLFGGFNPYGDMGGYGNVSIWTPLYLEDTQSFLRQFGVEVVPEPSSIALALMGATGIFWMRRRRHQTGA
jgi:secreted trypsin-like serine protease